MASHVNHTENARLNGTYLVFFFFQAEDGIRDYKVTGVQTCALPICDEVRERARVVDVRSRELQLRGQVRDERDQAAELVLDAAGQRLELGRLLDDEIGRASCRERV